jgi:hypothetical protein
MNEDQIKARIEELLGDERLSYKTANIVINAPLALIQLSIEVELHTLQKVLGLPLTNFKKLREE